MGILHPLKIIIDDEGYKIWINPQVVPLLVSGRIKYFSDEWFYKNIF